MKGFNLLELSAAMLIMLLLSALSWPLLHEYRAYLGEQAEVQTLYHALVRAQFAAKNQHETLYLQPKKSWSNGYRLVNDQGHIFLESSALVYGDLTWRGFPMRDALSFHASPFKVLQNGRFHYIPKNKQHKTKQIVVSRLAHISIR